MQTILFDLDGTLLPMDQDLFIEKYIRQLIGFLAVRGFEPSVLKRALEVSVMQQCTHQTEMTNEEIFWKYMTETAGEEIKEQTEELLGYYRKEFHELKAFTADAGLGRKIVDTAKAKGYEVVLATNPLFPLEATRARMSWAGLTPEDFRYVTTYENSHRSKPFPGYYQELAEKLMVDPKECLMVGNDIRDDMLATTAMGMETYLVTDCLIDRPEYDPAAYRCGSLAEFLAYVEQLPEIEPKA